MGTRIICLFVGLMCILMACAPDPRPPLWLRSIETLPQVKGFSRAGLFTINKKSSVERMDNTVVI